MPWLSDAYISLISEYEEGDFGKEEAESLSLLLSAYDDCVLIKTAGYGDACYMAGEAFTVYYDGVSGTKAKLYIAAPYFYESSSYGSYKDLSKSLLSIYSFYRICENGTPGDDEISAFISACRGVMLYSDDFIGKGSMKIRLSYYKTALDAMDYCFGKLGNFAESASRLSGDFSDKIQGFIVSDDAEELYKGCLKLSESLRSRGVK